MKLFISEGVGIDIKSASFELEEGYVFVTVPKKESQETLLSYHDMETFNIRQVDATGFIIYTYKSLQVIE